MKIIGHLWIESPRFVEISTKEQIIQTAASSILVIDNLSDSIELLHYCKREALPVAVRVSSVKESLFAHHLDAKYILTPEHLAFDIQKIAQHYLFDAQVIAEIERESQIEEYAEMGIDGVIFTSAISSLQGD